MAAYGLSEELHARIAERLYNATKNNAPIPLLSREYSVITMADAYAIQQKGLEYRLADGAEMVGRKIGITSEGMMKLLGCNTPDYGYLLASTQIPEGGSCNRAELNSPIVEGELAFILGKDLKDVPITAEDIIDATLRVVPCFEVCDTRFSNWKVTVRDTISDNAGAARFMLGTSSKILDEVDPATLSMTMEKNGQPMGSATGAEVMGSPINSMVWLANKLLEYGDNLAAGDVVLSGAFMAADPATFGDTYTMTIEGFPPLTLSFE